MTRKTARLYLQKGQVIETSQPEKTVEALRSTMVSGFLEVFPEGESLTHDLVDVRVGRSWAEVH